MRKVLAVAILVSLLALDSPDTALAQASAPYQPAPGDGVVLVRGGTRIELLVDSIALGGTELEMARVVFPPIRGGVARHHRHASIELIYLLSGELDHVVNGHAYRLRPGMVGIARPQDSVAHRVMSDEAVRALVIWTPAGELGRIRPGFDSVGAIVQSQDSLGRLRSAWISAYERGNAAELADLYTRDVVRMPYDGPLQPGRAAVVGAYESSFASRAFDPTIALLADEVVASGDLAIERGRYREILRSKRGPQVLLEEGKYVTLARLGSDGIWRYQWSIFNRDGPPRPYRE